jgi:hypothetical protein
VIITGWRTVRHQLLPDHRVLVLILTPHGRASTLPTPRPRLGRHRQVLPLAARRGEHHGSEARVAVVAEHEELELAQRLVLHELGPARGEEGALGGPADHHQPRPPARALQGGRHGRLPQALGFPRRLPGDVLAEVRRDLLRASARALSYFTCMHATLR